LVSSEQAISVQRTVLLSGSSHSPALAHLKNSRNATKARQIACLVPKRLNLFADRCEFLRPVSAGLLKRPHMALDANHALKRSFSIQAIRFRFAELYAVHAKR